MRDDVEDDAYRLDVPAPVPYAQQLAERRAEQSGMSRQQIAQQMAETSEATFDPENAPKVEHFWVDRGLKLSCEGANHPNHHVWKKKR